MNSRELFWLSFLACYPHQHVEHQVESNFYAIAVYAASSLRVRLSMSSVLRYLTSLCPYICFLSTHYFTEKFTDLAIEFLYADVSSYPRGMMEKMTTRLCYFQKSCTARVEIQSPEVAVNGIKVRHFLGYSSPFSLLTPTIS
jgi:hypothetical protein